MQMTKKYWVLWLAAAIMIVAASSIILSKKNKNTGSNNMLPVVLRSIKMTDGWGYEVLVDNKVYIHQDCIPGISSFKKFTTESEALLIGNLVTDKIKHGKKPVITLQEISDTHIHY